MASECIVTNGDHKTLSEAIACHQRGDVNQATRIYRCLLDEDPSNSDAFHLLGVAALQRGDLARAVEMIGRAIALNPGEAVFRRFQDYERLMAHWSRVLPVPPLRVDYEETGADLEGTVRRLIDWCGLEWEPACLAFHERKQQIRTAKVTQVRQPIYQCAVVRWKHYEPAMKFLFYQLPPVAAQRTDDDSSAPHDGGFSNFPDEARNLENVVC